MDPNACLQRLLKAIREQDHSETVQASADLLGWLLAGGALPDETGRLNRAFIEQGLARAADALEECHPDEDAPDSEQDEMMALPWKRETR